MEDSGLRVASGVCALLLRAFWGRSGFLVGQQNVGERLASLGALILNCAGTPYPIFLGWCVLVQEEESRCSQLPRKIGRAMVDWFPWERR